MSRPVTRSMSSAIRAIPTPSFRVSSRLSRSERAVARTLASLHNIIVDEEDIYADMPALIPIESLTAVANNYVVYSTSGQTAVQSIPLERQYQRVPRVATLRSMSPRKFSRFVRSLSDQELGELYRRSHQILASEVSFTAEQASCLHDTYWNRLNQVNHYYSKYNY